MRYWLTIYKMQDNLLLVGPKKGNWYCQDRPILFLGGWAAKGIDYSYNWFWRIRGEGRGLKLLLLKKGEHIWEDVQYVGEKWGWIGAVDFKTVHITFCVVKYARTENGELMPRILSGGDRERPRGRAALCKSIRKWQWPANLSTHNVCE